MIAREVSPTDMANDVKEIEYLAKQLEGIMQSVSPQNWDDVADSWFNLAKLSHGEWIGSRNSTFVGFKTGVRRADSHTSSDSDVRNLFPVIIEDAFKPFSS